MSNKKMLLVGAMGLVTIAFAAQDGQTMQRVLTENAADTYKIDSKVVGNMQSSLTGEMPLNVTTSMTYAIKTTKVDAEKGTAAVETTMTIDKLDAGNSPLASQINSAKIEPKVRTGTIDKRGHMVLDQAKDSADLMSALTGAGSQAQSTLFVELPDHAVKVGDTWDIVIPKNPFLFPEDQKLTVKLTGEKQVKGHDAWTVELSGKIKTDMDSSKWPDSPDATATALKGAHLLVKGSTELTGEGTVDKVSGKTLTLDTKGTMKASIDAQNGAITGESTATMTSSTQLQG